MSREVRGQGSLFEKRGLGNKRYEKKKKEKPFRGKKQAALKKAEERHRDSRVPEVLDDMGKNGRLLVLC